MKKEYAEAYVRWNDDKTADLNLFISMIKIYVLFSLPSIGLAFMSKRFVSATILVVVNLLQGAGAILLKRRIYQLTYHQRFLLSGMTTMDGSFIFLVISVSLVEVGELWTGYYALLPAVWLLVHGAIIGWTWWRVKNGDYVYKTERERSYKMVGPVIFFSIAGVLVSKIITPFLDQSTIRNGLTWLFFLMSVIYAIGCPNLLKAYLVRKFEIRGTSVEACRPDMHEKKPLPMRIFLVVLVGALIFIGIPSIVGIIAHYLGS